MRFSFRKIFLFLFLVNIFFGISYAVAAPVDPLKNPVCWVEEECAKVRTQFQGKLWLELTPEQQKQAAGGFYKDVDSCGETMGRCLPANVAKTEISFGGKNTFLNIGDFIKTNYTFALSLAGILAAAMVVVAGFQWVTSGGNSEMITSAKKRIGGAVVGMFIAYMSFFVLNTINPATVNLRLPQTWLVRGQGFDVKGFDQCDPVEGSVSRVACEKAGNICQGGPGYRGDMGACSNAMEFVAAFGLGGVASAGGAISTFISSPRTVLIEPVVASLKNGATAVATNIAAHPVAVTTVGGVVVYGQVKINEATGGGLVALEKDTVSSAFYIPKAVIVGAYDAYINGSHVGVCVPPTANLPKGSMCNSDSPANQCGSGKCVFNEVVSGNLRCFVKNKIGFCSDGGNLSTCNSSADCNGGFCFADASLNGIKSCSDLLAGSTCETNGVPCKNGLSCYGNRCTAADFVNVASGKPCQQYSNCKDSQDQCLVISEWGTEVAAVTTLGESVRGYDNNGMNNGAVGFCGRLIDTVGNADAIENLRKLYYNFGYRYCTFNVNDCNRLGQCKCRDIGGKINSEPANFAPHLTP